MSINPFAHLVNRYHLYRPSKKKYLLGMGIFDVFKDVLDSPLGKALTSDLAKSAGKKAFQVAANLYRKKYCNGRARPLLEGELHPYCDNFTGKI